MTKEFDLKELFKDKGALLEGHFLLSSGLHSHQYFQSALLLQEPETAELIGKTLADKFSGAVDVVVAPAMGGLIIGHEVARAKGCRFIFTEKDQQGNPLLRRGFSVKKGERALVIEDVITTGLSTGEVLRVLNEKNATVIGIGAICNRSRAGLDYLSKFQIPVKPLLAQEVESWEREFCPLCKKGDPVVKPGSRKQ